MNPGSRVTSDGIRISQFFFVLEGIKDRSLFRYFILYEKQEYSVLQGKRPLFRTIEKAFNLYTSIPLRFRDAISCLKLFSHVFHVAKLCGFRFVGLSEKSDTRLSVPCVACEYSRLSALRTRPERGEAAVFAGYTMR